MSTVVVRRGELRDADVLADFNCRMAMETEGKTLDRATVHRGVSFLLDPTHEAYGRYLVAEDDAGAVVGCLLLTAEYSDWNATQYLWIQSVFVREDCRRRGVFTRLFDAAKEVCRSENAAALRLYVEHDNARARATYEKLGMRASHYAMYEAGPSLWTP